MRCDAFDADVHELALGHLGEPDRSALLAHADSCARCAAELADVVAITDRLLQLAPEVEPPVGFEQRLVSGTSPSSAPSRRSWRLVAGAAAAAAVVVVALVVTAGDDGARTTTVLTAAGDPAGSMSLGDGRLELHLDGDDDWPGTWACEVRAEGRWVEVGTWTADDVVDGAWRIEVDDDVADGATAMRVRSAAGDVLYTASLD